MSIARTFLLFLMVIVAATGCTPRQASRDIGAAVPPDDLPVEALEQKKAHVKKVMDVVEKRNYEIEKSPAWIDWAYQGIAIPKLNDIPPGRYQQYRKYVDNGTVYIFVHPSYYAFFHDKKPRTMRKAYELDESIVDLFLHDSADNPVIQLEQEQQRNEKNFIEYLTTEEKLVILVLPRNYSHSSNYGYAKNLDEYARYINEIANGSPSILYMESESSSSGKLLSDDLIPLLLFLETVGAKTVLIGGGYVGRCQKEFYQYITNFAPGNYYIVPEVSTFSPTDLSEKEASRFIDSFKSDLKPFAEFVLLKTPGDVNIRHLPPEYLSCIIHAAEGTPLSEMPIESSGRVEGPPAVPAQLKKPE